MVAIALAGVSNSATSSISALAEPSWTPPVSIASGTYNSLAIALTQESIYLCSWEYAGWADGNVFVFGSSDGGATWFKTDVFGIPMKDGHPNMCAYSTPEGEDVVLVASCGGWSYPSGVVARSTDGGLSFQTLTYLPLGDAEMVNGQMLSPVCWMYMSIGTRASWNGGTPDSDIFVFGARIFGDWWSGLLYLSMTVSHDNGLTWEDPWTIVPFKSYYPEVTSDGSNLYMAFNSLEQDDGYASPYAMKSEDWGAHWSTPELIYQRTYLDGGCNLCSLQDLGDGTALLTASDHRPIYWDNIGMWGVLRYSDMSFQVLGKESGPEWNPDLGFAGKMLQDGRMALGWLFFNYDTYQTEVRFTYGSNVGFPLPGDVSERIRSLIATIEPWKLAIPVKTGLLAKLNAALMCLESGDTIGAEKTMSAFLKMVKAQNGKALTSEQAEYLTAEGNGILEDL